MKLNNSKIELKEFLIKKISKINRQGWNLKMMKKKKKNNNNNNNNNNNKNN